MIQQIFHGFPPRGWPQSHNDTWKYPHGSSGGTSPCDGDCENPSTCRQLKFAPLPDPGRVCYMSRTKPPVCSAVPDLPN